MRFTPVMLLLTMASMCSKPPEDSGDDDTGPAVQSFAPEQGHWTSTPPTPSSDGCAFYDGADSGDTDTPTSGFLLALTSDTTFTMTTDEEPGLESKVASCTLSDHSFACEPFELIRHDYSAQEYDAVVIVSMTQSGLFSDGLNLAATSSLGAVCEGGDCEALGAATGQSFPCTTVVENTASHDM